MTAKERDLARRWFDEVWNKQRREAIAEMMAPRAPIHDAGDTVRGPKGFYTFFDRMLASFSKIHVTIHDTVAQGDTVCVRWTCKMRHTGDGLGMAATGKPVKITGIAILRIEGNRIVEGWQNWDMLGMFQQIQGSVRRAPTYMATA